MRAAAHGLSLLSDPLDARILRLLEKGPLPLVDLRRAAGLTPQTTLRKHLKTLSGRDLLVRTQARGFASPVTYELSTAGIDLRIAAASVDTWLGTSAPTPMSLDGSAAKSTIKSLVDAWTTTMLRALVAKPLSLTELDRLLPGVDYPALERRLTALRLAGLIEAVRGSAVSTPYRVTRWLRESVGPLIMTADWESKHRVADVEPLDGLDVETIFLLAIPLLRIPAKLEGTCQLIVNLTGGKEAAQAGVAVTIDAGRPISCTPLHRTKARTAASGSRSAWLSALSGAGDGSIDLGGDRELGHSVVTGLRRVCQAEH